MPKKKSTSKGKSSGPKKQKGFAVLPKTKAKAAGRKGKPGSKKKK